MHFIESLAKVNISRFRFWVLSLYLVLVFGGVSAQSLFPVQVTTQVIAPTPLIDNYASTSFNRIQFTVLLRDAQANPRDVKFRIHIKSLGPTGYEAYTKSDFYSSKVTLSPNIPTILYGKDIQELFNLNNLFINNPAPRVSTNPGEMPEDYYSFQLEVWDDALTVPLSNANVGFAMAFVNRLEPPLINLPFNQQNLDLSTDNSNTIINFSWVPRHTGAPAAVGVAQYRLLIYPINAPGQSPYNAAESQQPIIKIEGLNFPQFTLFTLPNLPALNQSVTRRYAWRVQVYDPNPQQSLLFNNSGFSEVYTFSLLADCKKPVNPALFALTPQQLDASWASGTIDNSNVFEKGYEVQLREQAKRASWELEAVSATTKTFANLKQDTYYEGQVRMACAANSTSSDIYYSEWVDLPVARTLNAGDNGTGTPCLLASGVTFSKDNGASNSSMRTTWEGEVTNYSFEYKLSTASNWQAVNVNGLTYIKDYPNGTYNVRIGTKCANGQTIYGNQYTFVIPNTGGRLNCDFENPFDLTVKAVGPRIAKLSWTGDQEHNSYTLYFRPRLEMSKGWNVVTLSDPFVTIDSLRYGLSYEAYIEASCGSGVTVQSPMRYFQLDDPALLAVNGTGNTANCFPPDYATAEVVATDKLEFSWKANPDAVNYRLSYKKKDAPGPYAELLTTANKTSVSQAGLEPGATYEYFVQCRCSNLWSVQSMKYTVNLVFDPNQSSSCDTVEINTKHIDRGTTAITVRWPVVSTSHTGYVMSYRLAASNSPDWYTCTFSQIPAVKDPADTLVATISRLDTDTEYLIKVQSLCGNKTSANTKTKSIRTEKDPDIDCGSNPANVDLTNQSILANSDLKQGDIIHGADFDLTVTDPSKSEAAIEIKLWGSITFYATYAGATFNTDKQLIAGKIVFKSVDVQFIPATLKDQINSAISTIDGTFATLQNVLNQLDAMGGITNKSPSPVGRSASVPELVTGPATKAGAVGVSSAGVMTTKTSAFGLNPGTTIGSVNTKMRDNVNGAVGKSPNLDTREDVQVVFKSHASQLYGYDAYATGKLEAAYEKLAAKNIDWKSIEMGKLDRIDVTVTGDKSKLKFISLAGIEYKLQSDNSGSFLVLPGSVGGTTQEVYAWVADSTSPENRGAKIAKVNVASYQKTKNTVYLVPVNTAAIPDAATVKTKLNQIYGSSVAEWDVITKSSYNVGTGWDEIPSGQTKGDGKVQVDGSGLLDVYTEEMKSLIDLFIRQARVTPKGEEYYLFFGQEASNPDLKGFLPRGKNAGFVFETDAVNRLHVIAHELGHGLTLNHSWDTDAKPAKGATQNLMDYNLVTSNELWKQQWDVVQYPKVVVGLFENDDDAAVLSDRVYIDPAGYAFKLKAGIKIGGTVDPEHFYYNKIGDYTISMLNGKFNGYRKNGDLADGTVIEYQKTASQIVKIVYVSGECSADHQIYKSDYSKELPNYSTGPKPLVSAFPNGTYSSSVIVPLDCDDKPYPQSFFEIDKMIPQGYQVTYKEIKDFTLEEIRSSVNQVNSLISKNNTSYPYKVEMVKADLGNMSIGEGIPESVTREKLYKLDHRLVYLSQYSKELNNQINIYVVYTKIDFMIRGDWNAYAEKIYKASNLKDKNAILITIPFFNSTKEGNVGVTYDLRHYMPGIYVNKVNIQTNAITKIKATPSRYDSEGVSKYENLSYADVEQFIEQVYKQTYKPYIIYAGLRYADGTIQSTMTKSQANTPGYNFVKTVILSNNTYYDKIKALKLPVPFLDLRGDVPNNDFEKQLFQYELDKEGYLEQASLGNADDWLEFPNSLQFKEKQLTQEVANKYIVGYAFQDGFLQWTNDLSVVYGGTENSPPVYSFEDVYNKDKWSTLDPAIYATIDVASVLTSFVGADIVPESIGLMYAISRNSEVDAALYGAAVILPVVAAGELKAGMVLVKKLTAESKIVFRGFLYSLKADGKLVKLSTSYKRGRLLGFFKLSDEAVSPAELDAFIAAFKSNKISAADLKAIRGEADVVAKIAKFKNAARGTKLVDVLDLGSLVKKIGDYEVYEKGEVFYRGLSQADFDVLQSSGRLPGTSETFTSPTLAYIQKVGYGTDGVIVKFQMKSGTLKSLEEIGVRNNANARIMGYYPDMPSVSSVSNWKKNNALFKTEGAKFNLEQVNIGLGTGEALDRFSKSILNFQTVK